VVKKIALLDLNHTTRGIHTNTVPLGLGFITQYMKKELKFSPDIDIEIFKDPKKALSVFRDWTPDVLGLAQYCWNSELNLHFARLVKEVDPGCLIVAGGPNLDLSRSLRTEFLRKETYVDICISHDGEIPFSEIVKRLIRGAPPHEMRSDPVAGSYALHPETFEFIESSGPAPRLKSLDLFGTPYADGIFDQFLDDGFHPFMQTHRGCPFKCSFCHTSDPYYSQMLFLSTDIFRREMEYLGKRFAGRDNIVLYLANTNMSLFKEDFEIARVIREIQAKYNWPKIINVNSGKNPEKLLDMLSIIEFQPGIAMQTLTPVVLENIRRKNIPLEEFISFQQKVFNKTGQTSATELILCLPEETKSSFLDTVKVIMNSGIQNIVIYTLMNLKGTPIATEESAKRYGHVIRNRIVPRQFSEISGMKIVDTEEVIVGTDTMPFEDYIELRGLSFTIAAFFGSTELAPLKRLLLELDVDIAQWVFNIHEKLPDVPGVFRCYESFLHETRDELFETREKLLEFYSKSANYEALCEGRLGDNLLRKYKYILLFKNYKVLLELAITEARKLILKHINGKGVDFNFDDMFRFLLTRDMKDVFDGDDSFKEQSIKLNYDIPAWLSSDKKLFDGDFFKPCLYTVKLDANTVNRLNDLKEMNKIFELSVQILYRDGTIRDFWPKWICQ